MGNFSEQLWGDSPERDQAGAAAELTTLQKGEALWKVGDHLTRVYHLRSRVEEGICDTDANITGTA